MKWNAEFRVSFVPSVVRPGACPTNGISIELNIQSKFWVLWFKMCSTDHNEILHMSWQCYCRDVCKISFWSAEYVLNKSIANIHSISNSIEISLVGRALGRWPLETTNEWVTHTTDTGAGTQAGPHFKTNMSSYQYRKSHCVDKTILWLSYLQMGFPTWLYSIRAQGSMERTGGGRSKVLLLEHGRFPETLRAVCKLQFLSRAKTSAGTVQSVLA